jgi:hypothetical protein
VGVALNGVPIHAGLSEKNSLDFYSPKSSGVVSRMTVDECLGAVNSATYNTNFYHYYSFSPCMLAGGLSARTQINLCDANSDCAKNYLQFAQLNTAGTYRRLDFIGIAKDGHMIVGPFKSTGTLWQPCDVDICNGVVINNQYVYVSTLFFPYTVGCWGPASASSTYAPSCSSNTNVCTAVSSSIFGLTFNLIMVVFITFLMFN